jgi:hypothetical protein
MEHEMKNPDLPSTSTVNAAWAHEQALASAGIEGFEPSADFMRDAAELEAGRLSEAEFLARVERRAAARQSEGEARG